MRPENHSPRRPSPPSRTGPVLAASATGDRAARNLRAVHEQAQRGAVPGHGDVRPRVEAECRRTGRGEVGRSCRRGPSAGLTCCSRRGRRSGTGSAPSIPPAATRPARTGSPTPRSSSRRVGVSAGLFAIATESFTPSNDRARPKRPVVTRVAPETLPLKSLKLSIAVAPAASSNPNAATRSELLTVTARWRRSPCSRPHRAPPR